MLLLLITGAILIDFLLGDPYRLPHPVVLIGKLITWLEKQVRHFFPDGQIYYLAGACIVLITVGLSYSLTVFFIYLAGQVSFYLGVLVHLLLLYTTLAAKSLHQHAYAVMIPLEKGNLPLARQQLAKIVGRDTEQLNVSEIIRGAVETVAENTVDGITAPLFYAFIGGAPLAMAYKSINTLDSMLGYRDQHYKKLGWAAARLDDLANYLPARTTGLIFLFLSPFTPGGFRHTWYCIKRDAIKHPSPNSGIPEAAVAGMLKIQLGGVNYYRGIKSCRALMGDHLINLETKHIWQTVRIMYGVTLVAFILGSVITLMVRGVY